jgi:hypothetical protein
MNIKLGVGYKIKENFIAGADVNMPNSGSTKISLGGEYAVKIGEDMSIPIRLGYCSGMDVGGISYGVGFGYKMLGIDITLAPYGDLGSTTRIGLTYKF